MSKYLFNISVSNERINKGGGGGDNQDKCVWFVNVFLGLKSWCFLKVCVESFLMMVIRAWWTGPLPSCRFKGEATGFHPPPNLIAICFFLFFSLISFFLYIQIKFQLLKLDSRWVECFSWSSIKLIQLLYKPCFLHAVLKALSAGERFWQAAKVNSLSEEAS